MTYEEQLTKARKITDLVNIQNEVLRTKTLLGRCYVRTQDMDSAFYTLAIVAETKFGSSEKRVMKDMVYECCPLTPEIEQAMHDALTKRIKQIEEQIKELL